MQALTVDIAEEYPGVVIYGIGDRAHQLRPSDHNEDDTSGSKPAQSDSDSVAEHRAIDVMIGPAMSRAQLQGLVDRVVAGEQARERAGEAPRLFYIIFDGWLYSRTYGWVKQPHTDDPHDDHAHFSGLASGDENPARWPAVSVKRKEVEDMFCSYGETSEAVRRMQMLIMKAGGWVGPIVDGKRVPHKLGNDFHYCTAVYDDNTVRGLRDLIGDGAGDGRNFNAWIDGALTDLVLDKRLSELEPGKVPTRVRLTLDADVIAVE